MAIQYLLDTNVVSDFVRGDATVQARLRSMPPEAVALSSVSVMEIEYGLALNPARARRLNPVIQALLGAIEIVPLAAPDARAAGALRAALGRRGRPIGPYDVLLAGTALARGLVVVTANTTEFSRIHGLIVENWRERP